MDQNLLLKYIAGNVSQKEKEEVASWIDADKAHLKEFMTLRKSYDVLLWQEGRDQTGRLKRFLFRFPAKQVMHMAAVFLLAFGLGYLLTQVLLQDKVEMQTVYVPAGQRTQVTLADGTMVWVNGKSTLTFPSQFTDHTRRVELDGEAYFEVRKNPEKQFIVSTSHQSAIKVLGTKFNVKAYKESNKIVTTLVEGKVNFEFYNASQNPQYITMSPGQKLIYYPVHGKTELYSTSGEKELAWKDGIIVFKQTSLREALNMLAERYDVEFVIRENVPDDDAFSGSFTNRSLEQILNYIKASSKIRWHYLNNAKSTKETIKIEIFI